ncbi:apoptosis-stimulating of p53 protein 1 isoform X4 [Nilaparvata lugens]|uniref:apoptosis-stimulating of p53 protein 1 isoform X4 n=1 Tax=Nilaparvata lugens TaxID=108931 RepID=UPI00193DEDE6|nr:apoptosis-stimulating of p53 protein 1 isoform X4 [Nilaparvata lugens]
MVPMIIRVLAEGEVCEVPITPETTCADVIDCVRDPGDEECTLLQTWGHGYERVLRDSDKPYEILQEWGAQKDPCKLVLKYTVLPSPSINGRGSETRNGMKEPGLIGDSLPSGGCELTLGELEEMALRQQAQIEQQRQQLAAREQRLRFLKQHEARHLQVAAEHERLRHLRDRVHLQELKLRKLRALRGQLHHNKLSNAALTSDLDSIRALFNEKEKELSLAVAKVEELTTQLEELRRGGQGGRGAGKGGGKGGEPQLQSAAVQQTAAAIELEKLRRELMYRNKLNEQQTARLSQQREALSQRQEEVASIDKRIAELQDRLHRKRLLNQQLASQINAAAAANNHQQHLRSSLSATTIQQHQQQQQSLYQQSAMRGNIAAVEPYHHVPAPLPAGGKPLDHPRPPPYPTSQNRRLETDYNGHDEFVEAKMLAARKNSCTTAGNNFLDDKKVEKCEDVLPEFGASKSDPKYQTLPYNTKFGVNYVSAKQQLPRSSAEGGENVADAGMENKGQQQLMSIAHSTPVSPGGVNRGLATQVKSPSTTSDSPSPSFVHPPASLAASRVYGSTTASSLLSRGQPVGGASSTTSSTSSLATNSSTGSNSAHQTVIACAVEVSEMPSSTSITTCPSAASSKLCHEDSSTNLTSTLLTSSSNSCNSSTITATKTVFALPPTPLTLEFQKPISSVAPTTVQAHLSQSQSSSTKQAQQASGTAHAPQDLPSQIYQTSSTKIQPVQPQTLSSTPQGILRDQKSDSQDSGQESSTGSLKPALPPKPLAPQAGAKSTPPPPPRQMVHWSTDPPGQVDQDGPQEAKRPVGLRPSVDISADAVDSALNVLRGAVSISARGAMTSAQEYLVTKSSNSTYQPEPSDSSIPPPPPTTEPPVDDTPVRRTEPIKPSRPLAIIKQQQPFTNDPRSRVGSGFADSASSRLEGHDVVNSASNANNVRLGAQDVSPTYSTSESSESPASNVQFSTSRRIEMPPAFLFPETEAPPADLLPAGTGSSEPEITYGDSGGSPTTSNRPIDENCNLDDNNRLSSDKVETNEIETRNNLNNNNNNSNNNNNNINSISGSKETGGSDLIGPAQRRAKKGNLKGGAGGGGGSKQSRRVSFDPLALLLDASLEGELELVVRTAGQVRDPSAANDEGITALHNAICAGHLDIVRFLVRFGCDVNAQDSDGWTPLHCAASCNNLAMVKFLVEHGACIFATTLSDQETAAEKCEEDEEGFDGCSEYLYSVQEKLGILNNGAVFAVFSYEAHQADELSFGEGDRLVVLRKGDEWEREWWWTRLGDREGYVPRNLLGLYPRVHNKPAE